jgi:hypothetical protein
VVAVIFVMSLKVEHFVHVTSILYSERINARVNVSICILSDSVSDALSIILLYGNFSQYFLSYVVNTVFSAKFQRNFAVL